MKKLFLGLLVAASVLSACSHDDVAQKVCQYQNDMSGGKVDVKKCVKAYDPDDENVQVMTGIYYLSHNESKQAREWFEKGAKKNNPDALNGLGFLYQQGYGVAEDHDKANEYFRPSAEQGNVDSQFWLGENLVLAGKFQKGFYWTEKAAKGGSRDAQYNLGILYWNGQGVKKDRVNGYIWLLIAAKRGHVKAKAFVDGFEKKLDPKVVAEMHRHVDAMFK